MIVFKAIRWKNFLSTGNLFTEVEFDKHNTTLIVGENGAGKSTILDALSFGLFSKPFRKVNKSQLINTMTKRDLVVELELGINRNEYKIIRGIKPNIFEVYINGTLVNQSAEMKDYQEILEKQILKISHKSFCQVVVLGSASFVPFMQLPTGQRRDIIEDLLDLQIFTVMNNLLKIKSNENRDLIIENASDKKVITEKIKLIRQHLLEMQNNNEVIITEKKERLQEVLTQIESLDLDIESFDMNITELDNKITDEDIVSSKMKKLESLRHQIKAKKDILSKEVKFFSEHDNCPTCKQEINKEFQCEAIDTRKQTIGEIEDGLGQLTDQYEELSKRIDEIIAIRAEIQSAKLEKHKTNTKIESLNSYKKELEDEIKSIKKANSNRDDSNLIEFEEELKQLTVKGVDIEEDRTVLAAAGALLKDGGIKSRIIKQYIPIINKLINKYLSAMEFLVQFELDEEFNETIKSRHRDEFSYASFSEGEKMRINLAILFTWRAVAKLRNSISTNILIMDEVFDSSLDATGTEEFMKILNQLTVDTNTFIISHKTDQIADKFNNVIRFEKHKNFSRIAS
jgi:DNA repair exonuclease SbcCD ATPase subunit